MTVRRWRRTERGLELTFEREGVPTVVRYPDPSLTRPEQQRIREAIKLMEHGCFARAFGVLERRDPPGRTGRPNSTDTHAFMSRLRRITEEERLRAEAERRDYAACDERVRTRVARRLGVSEKTVSNLWRDARVGGWVPSLAEWRLRRVAIAYLHGGVRSVRQQQPWVKSGARAVADARTAGLLHQASEKQENDGGPSR